MGFYEYSCMTLGQKAWPVFEPQSLWGSAVVSCSEERGHLRTAATHTRTHAELRDGHIILSDRQRADRHSCPLSVSFSNLYNRYLHTSIIHAASPFPFLVLTSPSVRARARLLHMLFVWDFSSSVCRPLCTELLTSCLSFFFLIFNLNYKEVMALFF